MIAIRRERAGDEAAIRAVTAAAFDGHPYSDGREPEVVDRLRADGDLALSLVAEDDGEIVGYIAFSPLALTPAGTGWFTLGPVSVVPDRQGQGVGRRLIEAGLDLLAKDGAQGAVLVGDPDFYARFGFRRGTPLAVAGPMAAYFQVLGFTDAIPAATGRFAPAFGEG